MQLIKDDNLIIRWTFGETLSRPTSLQAFDMLECSIAFANVIFPNSRKIINFNSLKSNESYSKLKNIAKNKIELVESISLDFKTKQNGKNSFWKYYPIRIDTSKYEIILDNDVVLWSLPNTVADWLKSDGLLINSDWRGVYYGIFNNMIPEHLQLNAGIIGYPPNFKFPLPDYSNLPDLFHSEQGFIVKTFLDSQKQLFIISKNEIYQSNIDNDINASEIIKTFQGGHFCGCSYCHYFHWDKSFKDILWEKYYNL